MENYKPTKFMAEESRYDKDAADYAVNFIECLCHTKGKWAGQKFKLLPWQEKIIRDVFGVLKPDGKRQFNTAYVEISKKNGKQLHIDTPIPTPSGFTTMGELKVGDIVFDENGERCHVVAKSEIDDTEQAYKLTFRDGSTIIAGARHLWNIDRGLCSTEEIYQKGEPIRIPISKPLETEEKALPKDPCFYGLDLHGAIQQKYLRASKKQREEVLKGILDSKYCAEEGSVYLAKDKESADSVRELLWSLGIKNESDHNKIYFDNSHRDDFHYLKDIEMVPQKVKMQCIQVDSPSHQYLAGKSMVPTHNSELAAAVALFLLFGDGEPSAEVYGAAADRQQASIVFDVANQMVKMTPALLKRSKILGANKRIINHSNNGFYQVLSAEVGTKHGLNVSGLVLDEVHAQPNRQLYDVLTKGSGDAREQPLYFLITTAGNDMNSICYELHQKAKDILEGRKIDPTFYPVIYGAAEDDDWTDPETWKKANPSLGETITLEKVAAACESARQNPAEENSFRQLRLNQWVKQSVRWMPMEKWDKCSFEVDKEKLKGRICYGGLDLSSTTDLTCFSLVFPPTNEEDRYSILPYFWIPEDTLELRVRRDHVPYDVWYKQGFMQMTEGNVVHYGYIENFIEDLGTKYNIREIAFDRWGAVQMVQNLEGMGFTVVPFGQGFAQMSSPTKELMKLTFEEKIAHGGHPVLRWNMDNIFVRTDPAGNIKPDKEKSTEKIDGAIATIMALDRALRNGLDTGESVYDSRGLLVF